MPGKAPPKWLKAVGYPAFFLVATLVFLHLTLPYDALKARAAEEARRQGYELTILSLGPSLGFGVKAKGVSLTPLHPTASTSGPPKPTGSLYLDAVSVRPGLLPPGLHLSAEAFGGTVDGYVASRSKGFVGVELAARGLDLAKAGLKPLVGLDMGGTLGGSATLNLNPNDLSKTTGLIKISGKELVVNGGTVNYVDLPKAKVGTLALNLKIEQGKAAVDAFSVQGGDLEAKGDGNITLGNRLETSSLNTKIEFKPAEDWLKKYSFIGTGLHMAGHPNRDGYYTAQLTGILLNPRANLR